MSLARALKARYPNAEHGPFPDRSDFVLQDDADGKGPRIVKWNMAKLGTKPTAKQLAQWQAEHVEPEPTKRERLDKMLADNGLTMTDLKAALNN